jgi:hypothetical protein
MKCRVVTTTENIDCLTMPDRESDYLPVIRTYFKMRGAMHSTCIHSHHVTV